MLDAFLNGFMLASTLENLGFALAGCLLGTMIGVLPGVGPLATVSMLLSMTIYLDPLSSMVMLAGIFYGAQYGGSTAAILANMPGEASAVVTVLDGHQMARKGRAGAALAIAALGSLFAGICATLVIALFAPMLAGVALSFNAPEYFVLMMLGLFAAVVFSNGSMVKALAMTALGILLGCVGTDIETGAQRYTFNIPQLMEGIGIVAVSMGLFGLSEIIMNISRSESREVLQSKVGSLWPSRDETKRAIPAVFRGTLIGSALGVLPGGGVVLSTFASYIVEKKVSKRPQEFGTGAVEGLAGPESANNAAAQTSFIPLLTLGIPTTPTLALLMGAMIMQGVQPGPQVMTTRPDLFWGIIASMLIGNFMLVVINLPLIGLWVQMLRVPYRILFPVILVICCIGAYSMEFSQLDLVLLSLFAGGGVLLASLGFPTVPLLLGFILGPLAEENLRRAMAIAGGDATVFFTRPVSATMIALIVLMLAVVAFPKFRRNREVFEEG